MVKVFRVTVPVTSIEAAERFYTGMLGISGERVASNWLYFNCEGVLLACYDPRGEGCASAPRPLAEPLFIAVDEPLVHPQTRAQKLGATEVDPEPRLLATGEMGVRLRDPFGNVLCLVDARTMQYGRPKPAAPTFEFKIDGQSLGFERDFLNAVKGGELERVRELLDLDPGLANTVDVHGVSALMLAAYKRKPHIAAHLMLLRKDLSIWEACTLGDSARLSALLDARPELMDKHAVDGFTPLGLACFFGRIQCVRVLLERGADVNLESRNPRRLRPVHSAASHDNALVATEIVRALLQRGADLHARQEFGYTALHQAADRGAEPLVRLLLECGAVPMLKSEHGRTAADLATAKGHGVIVELLRKYDSLGSLPLQNVA